MAADGPAGFHGFKKEARRVSFVWRNKTAVGEHRCELIAHQPMHQRDEITPLRQSAECLAIWKHEGAAATEVGSGAV